MISKYFTMLTKGCGRDTCTNTNCATYKKAHSLSESIPGPNAAARTAVELAKNKEELCVRENSISSQSRDAMESSSSSGHGTNSRILSASSINSMDVSSLGVQNGGTPGVSQEEEGSGSEDMETSSEGPEEGEEYDLPIHLPGSQQVGEITSQLAGSMMSVSDHNYRPDASAMVGSMISMLSRNRGLFRSSSSPSTTSPSSSKDQSKSPIAPVDPMDIQAVNEDDITKLIEDAQSSDPPNYTKLKDTVFKVFSSVDSLNHSFLLPQEEKTDSSEISVDLESVRRIFILLDSIENEGLSTTLINALTYYAKGARDSRYLSPGFCLNHMIAMLHNPLLANPEHLQSTVPPIFSVVSRMSFEQQVKLVEWHSECDAERLKELVELVQQSIAFTIAMSDSEDFDIHSSPPISSAVCVLQILYFSNLYAAKKAGKMRPEGELVAHLRQQKKKDYLSPYEKMLIHFEAHPSDVIDPPLPFDVFLNDELNVRFVIDQDLMARRSPHLGFSFYNYPCCLSPVNKVEELQWDNLITMHQERGNLMLALLTGTFPNRYFDLRVDRDNLIQDTLMQLEIYSEDRPNDLRKQLRIHFRGEEGLDEGGVQKEFFQLLIAELLKPEYAMFIFDKETGNSWLNPYSYESEREYMLVGMLFGLAVYNNVILDIHFPMVVYSKLIGCTTVFKDLFTSHPTIAKSLQGLLEYEGEDFESVFNVSFCVEQTDVFGHTHSHTLKPSGASIPVTKDNRQEYVDLYTDWLLNRSIETQFNSFKKGFHMVIKGTSLINLLRPEELEQLVCGLEEWDFQELEASTHYDNGYTADHVVIRNFWEVVHEYDEQQKKAFLQFVTGTDRVPLGGLSKLKFTIVKHGDDSDRLPTAHTCFNVLLLCPYSTKEKLRERLLKAITDGKGFGML